MRVWTLAALAALSLSGAARAEVVDKGAYGFRLKFAQQVTAPPDRVFKAIGEIGRWWSDAHTYSGKAANMTMPLRPDACFCEALPGGGVRHGVVEAVMPNTLVRVDAALGPLQDEGVGAALAFNLKARDGGTELTVTYHVGGARDFVVSAAPAIDGVLGEAVGRLKRYVETGKPAP
ncbi:SRPBCC family protein [Phenylobacterium sp.]|uniref:SRPBCC family protein n=1 Tax=Phenylobacterium sp. TaxID=1871053 RepID=UPI003D264F0E